MNNKPKNKKETIESKKIINNQDEIIKKIHSAIADLEKMILSLFPKYEGTIILSAINAIYSTLISQFIHENKIKNPQEFIDDEIEALLKNIEMTKNLFQPKKDEK